jgi:hypothetical protein
MERRRFHSHTTNLKRNFHHSPKHTKNQNPDRNQEYSLPLMTTTRRNSRLRIYNYSSLRWRWTAIRSTFQCRITILQIQTRKESSEEMREYREWLINGGRLEIGVYAKKRETEQQHKTQAPHHISTDQLLTSFLPSQHTVWRRRRLDL